MTASCAYTQVNGEEAARLEALERDIGEEGKQVAELRRKSDGLSQKAAALEQQIENAGGEKLRKQKAQVAKLQEVGGS